MKTNEIVVAKKNTVSGVKTVELESEIVFNTGLTSFSCCTRTRRWDRGINDLWFSSIRISFGGFPAA